MRDIDRSTAARTSTTVGTRVLVVAERDDFAKSLCSRLEASGCTADLIASHDDAIDMARGVYDLILVDLEPSGLEGLNVLRRLKSHDVAKGCPVVLLKGETEAPHVIQRGLDLGAAGYVNKHRLPVTLDMSSLLQSFAVEARPPAHPRAVRADACPHSAGDTFHECSAFVPVNALTHTDAGPERLSCSRLRAGAADTWRLYPRCALGNAAARAKYVRDQGC